MISKEQATKMQKGGKQKLESSIPSGVASSCDQASQLDEGLEVVDLGKAVHPRRIRLEENTERRKWREKIKKKKWSRHLVYLKTERQGKPDAENMQINNVIWK